jgi:hypothetical protein
MTSDRQISANRLNAQKSTGPRSRAGKSRSRRNDHRHGLTAQTVLKSTEDPTEYRAFERAIIADFSPASTIERALVVRLASLLWRLKRATAMETESLANPKVPNHEPRAATRTTSMQRTDTILTAHAEPHSFILEAIISRISTGTVEYMTDSSLEESRRSHAPKLLQYGAPSQINISNHLSFELVLRYQTSLSRQLALALLGITQVRQQMNSTLLLRRRRHHSK